MKEANDLANHLTPRIQISRKRKRQASESNSQPGEAQPYHPARAQAFPPNYLPTIYDQLSKIKLTRQALKELDRRNNILAEPLVPTAPLFIENPTEDLPTRCGETPTELKRFARKGGPDLSDLKGFPEPLKITMGGAGSGLNASETSSQASRKGKRGEKGSGMSSTTVGFFGTSLRAIH